MFRLLHTHMYIRIMGIITEVLCKYEHTYTMYNAKHVLCNVLNSRMFVRNMGIICGHELGCRTNFWQNSSDNMA